MAREFSRTRRVSEQIKRDLAHLIRTEVDDPRMVMVSITSVTVSRDLGVGWTHQPADHAAGHRWISSRRRAIPGDASRRSGLLAEIHG